MRTAQFNYIKDYFSSVSIQLRKFKRNNVAFIEKKYNKKQRMNKWGDGR